MLRKKNLNQIVIELFIRGAKLNIFSCFYYTIIFVVPKNVRLHSTQCFVMKIPNKRELLQIVLNHSSDPDFKEFLNLYKKCYSKPYFILVTDTTLASDNRLHFRKTLLERT